MRATSLEPIIRQYLIALGGSRTEATTLITKKYLTDPEFHAAVHMAAQREAYLEFSPAAEAEILRLKSEVQGLEAQVVILSRELDDWVALEQRQRDSLVEALQELEKVRNGS